MINYYWCKNVSTPNVSNQLTELKGVNKVTIATAFLSIYGVELLEQITINNCLQKKNIKVYISENFSNIKCTEILERITKIADVFIVRRKFHAKVYYFQGNVNLLLFGSSNFTKGGIEDNIEFDIITYEFDVGKIEAFFHLCSQSCDEVNKDVIQTYHDTEQERKELHELQQKLCNKIKQKNNPYYSEVYEYDISDYYFTEEDYETLFEHNWEKNDSILRQKRHMIKNKLLSLNNYVIKNIRRMELEHHWMKEHITSRIDPNPTNDNQVVWIGVRYLKKNTVKYVKEFKLSGDGFGIPKYACIQFALNGDCFAINIFHAVKNDAHDRKYLREKISNKKFQNELIKQIDELVEKRDNLVWYTAEEKFVFDDEYAEDFINFYLKYDSVGSESYLCYAISPHDERLKDIDSISKLILEVVQDFLPLYNLISSDWENNTSHYP